jgi:hypothetical protein
MSLLGGKKKYCYNWMYIRRLNSAYIYGSTGYVLNLKSYRSVSFRSTIHLLEIVDFRNHSRHPSFVYADLVLERQKSEEMCRPIKRFCPYVLVFDAWRRKNIELQHKVHPFPYQICTSGSKSDSSVRLHIQPYLMR